jgi:hypothetical protein
VQVINAPGRFDRSPELLAHDVARWTTTDSTSVVCVTEVADDDRAAALAVEGWTTNRFDGGSKGETAILTKDAVRKVIHRRLLLLNNGGGKGRLSKSLYAPSVVTEAPSGRRTLVTACHLRAHIEGIWAHLPMKSRTRVKRLRKSGKAEIRAYIADVDAWRHQVHHLAAEYHVDDILVVADWNLSSGSKWVRDLMTELWPGLHMVTTKQPDLGHRTVGWVLTSMDGGQASKVYKAKASDHDAGWFTLTHVNAPHPNPKPVKPPADPFEKVTYNGALMDQKTKTAVQLGEKRLGYSLTILQGCYHPGVSQSAGTHDGGQVIDFAPFDFETRSGCSARWAGSSGTGSPSPACGASTSTAASATAARSPPRLLASRSTSTPTRRATDSRTMPSTPAASTRTHPPRSPTWGPGMRSTTEETP